jgi:hypothetical protein
MAEIKLEDLRKWFGKGKKGDWVRVGTDGEIKGQCAREPGEGKPKCMPRSKAHSMDKKDRASSARRKRRQDPMADRPGTGNKPIMVKTDKKESVDMNERNAGKSATGYNIYHDTYSAAMQHAYAHAKKKHGVTVRPSEIDDKVATGPKKPSTGKTVSHILKTDKKQNLHVQVYNTGRKYELNMYVESVNEASKVPAGMKFIASYVYKDANGKDHTHHHLRKGTKMTDPVVVYIDDKEWKTFQSFTKAKQAAINHIKGMKESVDMNEETAIAHQTPYGTVTAYKRDTKGMRGKQDGFKLTLKTKSGKTVDLGSHPKPSRT